jgi:hypothetical protein
LHLVIPFISMIETPATVTRTTLALATLSDATQIGSFIFVLYHPRRPSK